MCGKVFSVYHLHSVNHTIRDNLKMGKTIIAILAAAVITPAAFSASADTLMGAEIELNAWSQDTSYKGSEAGSEVNWTFEAAFESLEIDEEFQDGQKQVTNVDNFKTGISIKRFFQ